MYKNSIIVLIYHRHKILRLHSFVFRLKKIAKLRYCSLPNFCHIIKKQAFIIGYGGENSVLFPCADSPRFKEILIMAFHSYEHL
jgi:hypothetical protein